MASVAIALLLNGAPMDLPAPAVMIGDYVYVPARSVFERLGWTVHWSPDSANRIDASRPGNGLTYVLVLGKPQFSWFGYPVVPSMSPRSEPGPVQSAPPPVGPVTVASGYYHSSPAGASPRMIHDSFYVPIRMVTDIAGGQLTWDEGTRTVNLTAEIAKLPSRAQP